MSKRKRTPIVSTSSAPSVQSTPRISTYWLFKSEPNKFSIDHLKAKPNHTHCWDGVRNYQARNFMKGMKIGDKGFFYHSNAKDETGIVGTIEVVREAYPDYTALDKKCEYYDPKATVTNTIWEMVDVRLTSQWTTPVLLSQLKTLATEKDELRNLLVVKKGSRLSIQPVTEEEWNCINKLVPDIEKTQF